MLDARNSLPLHQSLNLNLSVKSCVGTHFPWRVALNNARCLWVGCVLEGHSSRLPTDTIHVSRELCFAAV